MNLEALAREAGLAEFGGCTEANIARFAALIRAQADAEASERLSIIADELIAGLGEPGRGLAEMIREGATALESHAAYLAWGVRRQALEDAARVCEDTATCLLPTGSFLSERCAAAVRALKDKP